MMEKIWRVSKLAAFTDVGKNTFIVTFAIKTDKQRVVHGKPWLFYGHLFSLQNLDGAAQLTENMINTEWFWIQIHNIPFRCMNCYYGNLLEEKIGKVLKIDVDDDDMGWGKIYENSCGA